MKRRTDHDVILTDDPLWYQDAIIYELHVRAFYDSNADGIGDFEGLIHKLDYLQNLGVTAVWLLPFYPSPLRDDGYDIADYIDVNPSYGTLKDFRRFLKEAHRRGLRVITELVINHTSTEHPWFQRARRSPPGSKHRDFYVWSDTPDRYRDARIIFPDFETSNWTYDPVARAYYWHRFYSHQPDLNFDNPAVHRAVFKALDFWMDMGVDGMRLDAIPYLYQREGTNCENLAETHVFLKKLRAHADHKYKNRMFLAEANQWPEDAAAYFGEGDECHMNFHFPLMPRMFMALQQENNFPIIDILEQTPEIPSNCQWAVFLRNHDELTLEMVTDEDRDYMNRVYAEDPRARVNLGIRRRLAPLLKVRRKVELMCGLLFALPGTPVLYYGDEIGMGDNIYLGDRDAVRTPMQWSGDRNAGFSRANPQKLYLPVIIDPEYHFEAVNVEAQQNNPTSLLWWMKRLIALRKQHKVFGRGTVEFIRPENPKILAFIRSYGEERLMVVANLSRFVQHVELDLSEYEGIAPMELFGHTEFPPIGELPYFLTLGPHSFYWFSLQRTEKPAELHVDELPLLEVTGTWENLLHRGRSSRLERALPAYLMKSRWFRGKARKISAIRVTDAIPLPMRGGGRAVIALLNVSYVHESPETYVLPMSFARGTREHKVEEDAPHTVIARLRVRPSKSGKGEPQDGILYDAFADDAFADALLQLFGKKRRVAGQGGEIVSSSTRVFRDLRREHPERPRPHVVGVEQTNTSVIYGDQLILKIYRLLEDGTNPDLEIGRYLTQRTPFTNVPPMAGALEYQTEDKVAALGLLQAYVRNQGDAWKLTLDSLGRYFEEALSWEPDVEEPELPTAPLLDVAAQPIPGAMSDIIGGYIPLARLLGERTAELHIALSAETEDLSFVPEPLSTLHQRSLFESARTRMTLSLDLLKKQLATIPAPWQDAAREVLSKRQELTSRLRGIVGQKIDAVRIRCHGDYHLGQVLYTGNDFIILDFEGEPARSIGERRLKRSPLRDVAGMVRSFHYAAVSATHDAHLRPEDIEELEPWAELWTAYVSATFLDAYLRRADGAAFIPHQRDGLEALLDFYLVEKCIYELGYELNNRPSWVGIPLRGLQTLLDTSA
jgi:maltose alpha-D-glucosyltransferase / alpha-amylase